MTQSGSRTPKPCRQSDCDYLEKASICFSREQLVQEWNQALRITLITLKAAEASRALSLSPHLCTLHTDRAIDQLGYLYILSLRTWSRRLSFLLIPVFTGKKEKLQRAQASACMWALSSRSSAPSLIVIQCIHDFLALWPHLFNYPENVLLLLSLTLLI